MKYNESFDIDFSLEGRVAIVTGAAAGIGKAIALLFARKGAKVVLCDLSETVNNTKNKIEDMGCNAVVCIGDITESETREHILATAKAAFGKVDVLVNVAGVALLDDANKITESSWQKTLDINLSSTFFLSQTIGNHMIENGGGKIINLASQASVIALDRHVAYCASKAALVSVTQVLAVEWAKYNINVNAISPTVVLTELGKKAWAGKVGEQMKEKIPAGRFGYPEEIAGAAVYLASDAANLITGANIVIDGAYTIQ
jgi:NAD(P)-dependent dehydrogenase (short-subunit alcohol dehydrogenase family)